MSVNIITRIYAQDIKLSVRIHTANYSTAVALGVSVEKSRWQSISSTLTAARSAYKRGSSIFIEDSFTAKLWQLLKTLLDIESTGRLTPAVVSAEADRILNRDKQKTVQNMQILQAKELTFLEFARQFCNEHEKGVRTRKGSTSKIAASTLKLYKAAVRMLGKYAAARHIVVGFDDITLDFHDDYINFCVQQGLKNNTIAKYVYIIATILRSARLKHLTDNRICEDHHWYIEPVETDNIYITADRIEQLRTLKQSQVYDLLNKVPGSVITSAQRSTYYRMLRRSLSNIFIARDIFVAGCLSGQRVSDYKRFSPQMIRELNGRMFIEVVQKKTGKQIYIPASQHLLEIVRRYPSGFPAIREEKIITYVRLLALLLGWTESAGLNVHDGHMTYPASTRFYEAIMTHTARRSFATNAYKRGISLASIMSVTGHSSESMLRKYLRLSNKEKAILAADEFSNANIC